MMCEKAGEVTAQTRSKSLQLGAIFRAYSKVRTYLRTYVRYLSKQLYNPQQVPFSCHTRKLRVVSFSIVFLILRFLNFATSS
jgi:hypothetical protein